MQCTKNDGLQKTACFLSRLWEKGREELIEWKRFHHLQSNRETMHLDCGYLMMQITYPNKKQTIIVLCAKRCFKFNCVELSKTWSHYSKQCCSGFVALWSILGTNVWIFNIFSLGWWGYQINKKLITRYKSYIFKFLVLVFNTDKIKFVV